MNHQRTFSLTVIALGAAILAVLSPMSIPLGLVPITLQTFVVGLLATVLRPRESFFSILLYLILGFIGLPVFTGGASGVGVLFGPTGGFLVAFLLIGWLISFGMKMVKHRTVPVFVINLLGFMLMLGFGTVWLKMVTQVAWGRALTLGFTPFLPLELGKAVVASLLGLSLIKVLAKSNKYFTN